MNFLTHLSEEHKVIGRGLKVLDLYRNKILKKETIEQEDLAKLLDFFEFYVEKNHHGAEEDILFCRAGDLDMVREGGPMCTAFMGHRMEFDPVGKAAKRLKSYQAKVTEKSPKENLAKLYKKNHPLIMPLEEHLISGDLLKALRTEKDPDRFYMLAQDYMTITEYHSRKEDECLFILLSQLFKPNELEGMYRDYLDRIKTDKIKLDEIVTWLNKVCPS